MLVCLFLLVFNQCSFYSFKGSLPAHIDNITIAPWGDVIISEDGRGPDRLVNINSQGDCLPIAMNSFNNSEFAGATFSPNGKTLFVNIYQPTMTLAITGPWEELHKTI